MSLLIITFRLAYENKISNQAQPSDEMHASQIYILPLSHFIYTMGKNGGLFVD